MSKFGVTEKGFNRKTYNDILEDLQARAREVYGDSINLTNTSFLGMHLQNEAWEMAEIWEVAEDTYHSSFVDSSEGISLDNTGKYITITRKGAQFSNGIITIEGAEGTIIEKGFRITDEEINKVFETKLPVKIDSLGVVDIPIISVVAGLDQNVPPNTLTKAVNPIAGIDKIYNNDITEGGTNAETDKEFRERYYRSPERGGGSTRGAVEATLLDMDNVTDAFVEENDTMEFKEDIPPKSLAPYIFGGKDEDIANVILETKAGGIRSYGTTEILTADKKGQTHTIGFTRPLVKEIDVKVKLDVSKGYVGDDVVKRAVINYIGGEDEQGIKYKGLKLGKDVVISKLMANVMNLQGIRDIDIEISSDGITYQATNIAIAKKEIAQTKYNKVVISYV